MPTARRCWLSTQEIRTQAIRNLRRQLGIGAAIRTTPPAANARSAAPVKTSQQQGTAMPDTYLTQDELANRWRLSPRTLERWRCKKTGPNYIKIGGRILYAIGDVLEHERQRRAEIKTSPILGRRR